MWKTRLSMRIHKEQGVERLPSRKGRRCGQSAEFCGGPPGRGPWWRFAPFVWMKPSPAGKCCVFWSSSGAILTIGRPRSTWGVLVESGTALSNRRLWFRLLKTNFSAPEPLWCALQVGNGNAFPHHCPWLHGFRDMSLLGLILEASIGA